MADLPGHHCLLVIRSDKDQPAVAGEVCGGGELAEPPEKRYEIGSITKVMQGIVLRELVTRGRLQLDQSVTDFMPELLAASGDWQEVSVQHLLTHSSGLPRMPPTRYLSEPENPFVDFTPTVLREALLDVTLGFQPGTEVQYSNLGGALLSWIIDTVTTVSLTEVYQSTLWQPAGMLTTSFTGRTRTGYGMQGQSVSHWDIPEPLAGFGGARSSAADLSRWLDYLVAGSAADQGAVAESLEILLQQGQERWAWGWEVIELAGRDYWLHTGATGGFSAMLALEPQQGRAVLLVLNAAQDDDRWLQELAVRTLRTRAE